MAANLWPQFRDVIQILGIHRDLLKQPPLLLDGSEIILRFVFASLLFEQSLLPPDAPQRLFTQCQLIVAFDAASSPGREFLFEPNGLALLSWGNGSSRLLRSSALIPQSRITLLLIPTQPFTDRLGGGAEDSGYRLDPLLLS